jgi:hypothetical protein
MKMSKNYRGLIVDILFPNRYSIWRNVEIKNFIQEYDVDILVSKVNSYAGITFDFDWEFINSDGLLQDYNILIFDNKYNFINMWNSNLDGTQYNTNNGFSYLITKKNVFDLSSYDFIYHIFLMCYDRFNQVFNYDINKQFIHLYPGGGFFGDVTRLPNDVNLISTHPVTTKKIELNNHTNFINAWTAPLMGKNEKFVKSKNRDNRDFTVCFSSMGPANEKGLTEYHLLSSEYSSLYPNDNVRFITIGNNNSTYGPMDYISLLDFYEKNVDIYINLSTKEAFNGWPLGLDSVIRGCVLITTDPDNIKNEYKPLTDDEFYIVNDYKDSIPIIKLLFEDVEILNKKSNQCQDYFKDYFDYDNNQEKIFNFINNKMLHR